jgi:hypothetical protein
VPARGTTITRGRGKASKEEEDEKGAKHWNGEGVVEVGGREEGGEIGWQRKDEEEGRWGGSLLTSGRVCHLQGRV